MGCRGEEQAEAIAALRVQIGRIGRTGTSKARTARLRFGLPAIDDRLPGGGLPSGVLHEVLGHGPDTEYGVQPGLLVGGLLARLDPGRPVLWATQHDDLFPPGLAGVGLPPRRLILAESGRSVLAVMEEALRHSGLAAVVGEFEGRFDLTASRRLQLAAEAFGVTAFVIRRSRRFDDPALLTPNAAVSRWRVSSVSSAQAANQSDWLPSRALWRLELLRCREASPFSRIVQACDVQGCLADAEFIPTRSRPAFAPPVRVPVAAFLADRPPAARRAG